MIGVWSYAHNNIDLLVDKCTGANKQSVLPFKIKFNIWAMRHKSRHRNTCSFSLFWVLLLTFCSFWLFVHFLLFSDKLLLFLFTCHCLFPVAFHNCTIIQLYRDGDFKIWWMFDYRHPPSLQAWVIFYQIFKFKLFINVCNLPFQPLLPSTSGPVQVSSITQMCGKLRMLNSNVIQSEQIYLRLPRWSCSSTRLFMGFSHQPIHIL